MKASGSVTIAGESDPTVPPWTEDSGPSPEPGVAIDDDSVALYRLAIRRGFLDLKEIVGDKGAGHITATRISECVAVLLSFRLLKRVPDLPEILLPVSPDIAQAELISPLDLDISRRKEAIELIRGQLSALAPAYEESRRKDLINSEIELIGTTCAMRAMIQQAKQSCEKMAMVVYRCGAPGPDHLARTLPQHIEMLRRGIDLRLLLQNSTRSNYPLLSYAKKLAAAGGQWRTIPYLCDYDLLIFDNSIAFIPLSRDTTEERAVGGLAVRNGILVGLLRSVFESGWFMSAPLLTDQEPHRCAVGDETKRSVARLLGMGLKDEAVARRLGLSIRTCRKHISDLMQELGASSRFQAGARAVRRGLLD